MRPVHFGLLALIVLVALVGVLEVKPALEDFDPVLHKEFADTWADRVHLSYWEKWSGFEADGCQAMCDAFNRSQDGIYVHYVRTSQVDRKAMLAAIGRDPPDILGLWNSNLVPFADGGAIRPLDDLMRQSGIAPDMYIENYLKLGQFRGKTYALPTAVMTLALCYNKEHFRAKAAELRAAGLDPDRPPRTIEELDRYADVLNEFAPDGTPRIMGFLPTEPGWYNHAWGYFFGGKLVDPETGAITTDEPANVRAYAWTKRYAERYGRDKLLQFRSGFGSFDSPYNAFIEGKVSMEMQGVWFPMFIRRHRPQLEFGVAPFPCAEGVPGPRSLMEMDVVAIPTDSPHPKEAWTFVCWMQKEGLAILARIQGKNMPVKDPPPWFHQGHPNLELKVFEDLALSPHSFIVPHTLVGQEYRDAMNRAFEHIWGWEVEQVCAAELAGLTGAARQARIDELCRGEVERTLRAVREDIERKLRQKLERERFQPRRAQ
ncbi:MAG TPA: extracellular solute-binding protein [Phycisphaerae bacterium]|nr:extracellular solute-binding protein [Phycisphaerae bacterium]